MKRACLLVLFTSLANAQTFQSDYAVGLSDPTGICPTSFLYFNVVTGRRFICEAGVWQPRIAVDADDIFAGTVNPLRLGSGTDIGTKFLRGDSSWQDVSGGAATWGGITGTLASQTDLQTALDGKQASGTYSGTGACGANTWASTLGAGAPTCTQPGFSNLSGSATDAQVPDTITIANLTQVTTRAISDTTGTLLIPRGGTGSAPGSDDQLLVSDSTSAATWRTLTDCQGAGKALTYIAASNTWGCNTISGSGPTTVVLSADRTNATTAYANITDLAFTLAANTRYRISCVFQYNANATTTGLGVGWTGPASPTFTTGQFVAPLTTATIGGTISAGNDTGAVTTGSAATTANSATFEGVWSNGANAGTLQMRYKSEVAIASAIIIKAGSMCQASVY